MYFFVRNKGAARTKFELGQSQTLLEKIKGRRRLREIFPRGRLCAGRCCPRLPPSFSPSHTLSAPRAHARPPRKNPALPPPQRSLSTNIIPAQACHPLPPLRRCLHLCEAGTRFCTKVRRLGPLCPPRPTELVPAVPVASYNGVLACLRTCLLTRSLACSPQAGC